MSVTFSFEDDGEMFFGKVRRPIANVAFQSPKSLIWVKTQLVVDTGADFTILPRHIAELLSISLEHDCVRDATFGIGGEQVIYLCKTRIRTKIDSMEREVPLAFFDSNEVPAIMGRLGFFETFNTEFRKELKIIFKD